MLLLIPALLHPCTSCIRVNLLDSNTRYTIASVSTPHAEHVWVDSEHCQVSQQKKKEKTAPLGTEISTKKALLTEKTKLSMNVKIGIYGHYRKQY